MDEQMSLAERIDYALQESLDRCARCKTCERQVDAVMAVLADLPAVSSAIAITSRSGGPLTITPEAAAAMAEAGLVTVSREDLNYAVAIADGLLSGQMTVQEMAVFDRLAAAAGDPPDGPQRHAGALPAPATGDGNPEGAPGPFESRAEGFLP